MPGVYARRLMPQAEALLQRGDGSLARLLDLQGLAVPIESWGEVALDVNTPEALLRAETFVRSGCVSGRSPR